MQQKARNRSEFFCKMNLEKGSNHYKRHTGKYIGYTFKHKVDNAAVIALYGAVQRSDNKVNNRNKHGYKQAELNAVPAILRARSYP